MTRTRFTTRSKYRSTHNTTPPNSPAPAGRTAEHRLIASGALGKPLPQKAIVHHVDGNKLNNAHSNLVVCESSAYHNLLHLRTRALEATGIATSRRCMYCSKWDLIENLEIYRFKRVDGRSRDRTFHRICARARDKIKYRRKLNTTPPKQNEKDGCNTQPNTMNT